VPVLSPPEPETVDGHDAPAHRAVAALLAGSVPAGCAGLVAYHARGYPAYLAAALAPPLALRTVLVRALRLAGQVVAAADWRLTGTELLCNGIAVDPAHRGRGHGSHLLRDGLALARALGAAAVCLDVDLANTGARALYQRFGFRQRHRTRWYELPAAGPVPPGSPPCPAVDWPVFAAHRAAYGFADLTLRRPGGGTDRVRVVGDVARVPTDDPQVRAALHQLVRPARTYTTGPDVPGAGFARFARMYLYLREETTCARCG
jgi:GNAT superfamily N-acetyltransferase